MKELSIEDRKEIVRKARTDNINFIQKMIIEPYNEATGENYFITRQQNDGLKAICELVNKKLKGECLDILGVSIMSGKGTGKDAMTAWAILWFMFCFPYAKAPCVSVSADQLNKVLWSEISKWLSKSHLRPFFTLQTDKLFYKDIDPNVRGKEWFAFPKAANPKSSPDEQVETLAGQHADFMMEVIDEGSGVLDPVYETLERNMTSDCNFMLLIFNPMHAKGYALDTQYKNSQRWVTLRWRSDESEIVNQNHVRRLLEDYGGANSNVYRMNVLGLPPLFDENTLINWEWVTDAIDRQIIPLPDSPMVKAVDCGAGGDNSIIATRRGNKVLSFKRMNTDDSNELANWIGRDIDDDHPDVVRVDTIGIGWAVEGILRDKKGSIVEAADVRRTADEPERFVNKRAEMYWSLRELFEKGLISIPDETDLKNQIAATRYEIDNKGRVKIIEKKKIKAEIGHSPDEFDALAMLYFVPDTMVSRKTSMKIVSIKPKGDWMAA